MDPVVAVGATVAVVGTALLAPRTADAVRVGRLPTVEVIITALLLLSVDWTDGHWPTWQVAGVFFFWVTLLVVYPDGRPVPVWAVGILGAYALTLLVGGAFAGGYESEVWGVLLFAGLAAAGAAQVWRYRRRSSAVEREAAQWLLVGFVVSLAVLSTADMVGVTPGPGDRSWWAALLRLTGLVLPVSAALGLAISGRFAANPVLHRTATVCLTVIGLAVLYRVTRPHVSPLALVALIATVSPILLVGFNRVLEPVVYGSRATDGMRRLGQRLQATLGPDDVVVAVGDAVRDSLAVSHAEVVFPYPDPALEPADGAREGERFPVTYQGHPVATIIVSPRPAEPALTMRDRAVLATLARQAGAALHGARLIHELRAARERLVTAREAERRRIRRDLHDDLGPSLAGLGLTSSALQRILGINDSQSLDLPSARRLAEELTAGIIEASTLVRRVVYDLQPPGLEGSRLLPDLVDRLTRPSTEPGGGMEVVVHVELDLTEELPAAVEVATTRIVTEAVANARRHAQASHCTVTLTRRRDTIVITVHDNGRGLAAGTALGVGLRSIEERADELAGRSELVSDRTGTTVRVTLPLPGSTVVGPA